MGETRDLVVIGGGSGGFAAAVRAAQLGADVAIVEQEHFGGNCMHGGCIPLTFLMRASGLMDAVRGASSNGLDVGEPAVDMEALHDRKDMIIDVLRMGTEEQLDDYGVAMITGHGKLVARDSVAVAGKQIQARSIIVATGSVAGQLPVEGGGLPGVLSTGEAINLRQIPDRIAVVGNQPWEIELAQYFNAMGSEVVLISDSGRLLPEADREISQRLAKYLHDSGVEVRRGDRVQAIREGGEGQLEVVLAGEKGETVVNQVLASPRFPNSAGLGLREVGVATERGAILVDQGMETNVSGIYAIGDVTGGAMWSHKANAEGIVAAENAMGMESRIDYGTLPRYLHTRPEVAWVGLTSEEAGIQGLDVRVGKVPIAINPYAMLRGETEGAVKVVADKRYGKILGVHIMGPGAIDLINAASVAMASEATVQELMRLMPAHPSVGEALVDAGMDVEGRSLHLPKW
jgi:dihydrolipoamide dehydrogenase